MEIKRLILYFRKQVVLLLDEEWESSLKWLGLHRLKLKCCGTDFPETTLKQGKAMLYLVIYGNLFGTRREK